jgi:coenzyme F420-reducing hydrogenase delta subunit/heterodisulfide reductase subunit C
MKRIKKWENELNKCIRCGYCYELCPLFKTFRWESDTPRGKLLLVYGMLTGEMKPSQEIAEKIFQCFYCQKCEDNCSAGVPVTDILTDARYDLLDAGFEVIGTTVQVNEDYCSVCGVCIAVCTSEALSIQDEKIRVNRVDCKGCGLCVAACPAGAIFPKEGFGVSLPELHSKILDKKIVVFCCNWSVFPGLQLSAGIEQDGVIVSMCSGRITPELVLDAFKIGAWGVMVAGCPPEECEHNGNYKTKRRLMLLKNYLKQLNIEPERVKWFPTLEPSELERAVNEFADNLEKLGPIGGLE